MESEVFMYLGDDPYNAESYWLNTWFIPHENLAAYLLERRINRSSETLQRIIQFTDALEQLRASLERP